MQYTEQIIWNVFQDEMNQLDYPTEEMGGEEGCCLIVLCFLFSFWSWRFEMRFTTENDMIPLIPGLGCIIIPYNPVKWVLQPECQTICTTASRPQFTGATSIFNFFFRFQSFFLFLLLYLSFFPCVFLSFLPPFYLILFNSLFILILVKAFKSKEDRNATKSEEGQHTEWYRCHTWYLSILVHHHII